MFEGVDCQIHLFLHIVEPFEGNIGWETVGVVLGYIFLGGQNL